MKYFKNDKWFIHDTMYYQAEEPIAHDGNPIRVLGCMVNDETGRILFVEYWAKDYGSNHIIFYQATGYFDSRIAHNDKQSIELVTPITEAEFLLAAGIL